MTLSREISPPWGLYYVRAAGKISSLTIMEWVRKGTYKAFEFEKKMTNVFHVKIFDRKINEYFVGIEKKMTISCQNVRQKKNDYFT